MTRSAIRVLAALFALAAGGAWAFGSITVDGSNAEWAAIYSCFNESLGDGRNGVDLSRACLENDNTPANSGRMYALVETSQVMPAFDMWLGFAVDTDQNGTLNELDELFVAFFPRNATAATRLDVLTFNSYRLKRSYSSTATCGGNATSNGWSAARIGRVGEVGIAYGCLGLSYGNDYRLMQVGIWDRYDVSSQGYYNGTTGSVDNLGAPPNVSLLTAVGQVGQVRLYWTNPTQQHRGVLILRSAGAAPTTAPTDRTRYAVGQTVGNAQVVYSDDGGSTVNTFLDTGRTNGTRYYYKVYNHHQSLSYASGAVPGSSGIFAEPTSRAAGKPLWCYSTGLSNLNQPVIDPGAAVYAAGNLGAITANVTSTADPTQDGNERFRPVLLGGPVQSRFPVVPIQGRSGSYIVTGDQSGRIYEVNAATGAVVWTSNGGLPLGDRIQAQPVVQLVSRANAAFSAVHSQDLFFVPTRNNNATNNKVYAIRGGDGTLAWTYAPGDLDIVNGGGMVDYTNNRLFVASRAGGGPQASLRIISTIDRTEVRRLLLGDIDTGVVRDFGAISDLTDDRAVVANTAGLVYGIDLVTLNVVWSVTVGALSSYPLTTNRGFIASVKSGSVQRWSVALTGGGTRMWSTPIANPSGVRIDYVTQKVYAGSSDGKVHQLNVDTGVDEKQVSLGSQTGMPTLDTTTNRLLVGTADGRLCAFPVPFN